MHNRYRPSPRRPAAILAAVAVSAVTILTTIVPPETPAQDAIRGGVEFVAADSSRSAPVWARLA